MKRRMKWLGHLLRLPDDTPAKQAFHEYHRKVKRPRGKPKTTWIQTINKDLKQLKLNTAETREVRELATDRKRWNLIIEGVNAKSTNDV